MTIVIVYDFGYVNGGAAQVAIENAVQMKRLGHDVIYFTAVAPIDTRLTNANIKIVCTKQQECLKNPNRIKGALNGLWNKKSFSMLNQLLKTLKKNDTVVHVHGWTKALSASVFAAIRKNKFQCVVTVHDYFLACPNGGMYNYQKNKICTYSPLSLQCLICNCDKRSYIQKLYRYVRQVIQNYQTKRLDLRLVYISNLNRQIINGLTKNIWRGVIIGNPVTPIPPYNCDKKVVPNAYVFIGRLSPEKGADLFCEAIARLNLKGIVIGDGEMKEQLITKYQTNDILFTGWLKHREIGRYLIHAKAFVMTSRWYEGAPLIILEIEKNYDIPVIVGDKCNGREYVDSTGNGILFKMGDVDSLIYVLTKFEKNYNNNIGNYQYHKIYQEPDFSNALSNMYTKILANDGGISENEYTENEQKSTGGLKQIWSIDIEQKAA